MAKKIRVDDDNKPFAGFTKPRVVGQYYIMQGPSGWAETFDRTKADAALKSFLGAAPMGEVVDLFVKKREIAEDKTTNWETITGFLARQVGSVPTAVPVIAAVALWGQYILALNTRGAN